MYETVWLYDSFKMKSFDTEKSYMFKREKKKKRKLIWYWSKYKMQSGTKGTYLDIKSNFSISYQILKVEFFWYNWINGFLLLLFGSPNKK